jgi:glycosyltransferase involved in cell wall biosynthesis
MTNDDVIFFDDFWHPGISALPYAFYLMGIAPKTYAFLYAQSVDPFDFTYPMRRWMRHYEIGEGKFLDGIFVTSTCLKDMCLHAGIGSPESIHVCGLLYNSDEVRSHIDLNVPDFPKKKQVIFTSRWDREKCPELFLKVVEYCSKRRDDISFLITTSAKKMRSNDSRLLLLLREYLHRFPKTLRLKEGLTKAEYYQNLIESAIQINTADQDFVSWTLLEATTWGCRPLYPYFLSFPETLDYRHEFMYTKGDFRDAGKKILKYIDEAAGISAQKRLTEYEWIYKKYDHSWKRMLNVMKGESYESLYNSPDPV